MYVTDCQIKSGMLISLQQNRLQQATAHSYHSLWQDSGAMTSGSRGSCSPVSWAQDPQQISLSTHSCSTISAKTWCWFQRSPSPAGWPWLQLPACSPPVGCVSLQQQQQQQQQLIWDQQVAPAVTSLWPWRTQCCADEILWKHASAALPLLRVLSLACSSRSLSLCLSLSPLSKAVAVSGQHSGSL